VIFDTDVLIWFLRGNVKAARWLEREPHRAVSIVSLMELYQGAQTKADITFIRRFLQENTFDIVPIDEAMSHLAATLVEEHYLKDGVQLADALIAATARETGSVLATGNVRHFRSIAALQVKAFRPS